MNILTEIIAYKREFVANRKQRMSLEQLKVEINNLPPSRDLPFCFVSAIEKRIKAKQPAIIAEIKKASPSKGIIREDFNVEKIAKAYTENGAACLSILTDEKYFQGHDEYLVQAKAVCNLPILRKDFIIDEYQIYEARLIGADCILLIVAALTDEELKQFSELAQSLSLDVLVEVHTQAELERALKLNTTLIGINNRDLQTFKTDLRTIIDLLPQIPADKIADKIIVAESGINTIADIHLMQSHNVHVFLIGESLMRAEEPGQALQQLLASCTK